MIIAASVEFSMNGEAEGPFLLDTEKVSAEFAAWIADQCALQAGRNMMTKVVPLANPSFEQEIRNYMPQTAMPATVEHCIVFIID